jgi:hypothetical protein
MALIIEDLTLNLQVDVAIEKSIGAKAALNEHFKSAQHLSMIEVYDVHWQDCYYTLKKDAGTSCEVHERLSLLI